jgi:predicted O-methyltransferase YrrM
MLPAMTQKPTLTSIEPDPAAADLAKRAFSSVAAGGSVRSVHSSPAQVLPRLADASYDLVLLATDHLQWPDYLKHLTRLLRPNGIMVCLEAMCEGAVADPAVTDPVVTAVRAFNATVREEPRWTATMFNVDGGLLLARWAAPND